MQNIYSCNPQVFIEYLLYGTGTICYTGATTVNTAKPCPCGSSIQMTQKNTGAKANKNVIGHHLVMKKWRRKSSPTKGTEDDGQVIFAQRPDWCERGSHVDAGLQHCRQRAPGAKALRGKPAWCVEGQSRKPIWLEQNECGEWQSGIAIFPDQIRRGLVGTVLIDT